MKVTRETLFAEVWAEPMTTVARKYGISSNFLARVCERLKVPKPSRGYWAKLKAGRKLPKPSLPAPQAGDELEWCRDGSAPAVCTDPSRRGETSSKKQKRSSVHPLLMGAREHFEAGRTSTYRSEKYLRPHKRNIVDLLASKEGLPRALKAASDLFLALEERGHHVVLAPNEGSYTRIGYDHRDRDDTPTASEREEYRYGGGAWGGPARPTIVFIRSVAIGLSLFELAEEVECRYVGGDQGDDGYVRVGSREDRIHIRRPHDWTTRRWLTSGRIGVHAYAPTHSFTWDKYWRERNSGELGNLIPTIVEQLEDAAPTLVALAKAAQEEAEERKQKWEIERREMEKREAERRRLEEAKAKLEELERQLERWRFARDARAFVSEIEDIVRAKQLKISRNGPLEEHLDWILQRAMDADPLAQLRKDADEMAAKHRTWAKPQVSPLRVYLERSTRRRRRWRKRLPSRAPPEST